MILDDLRKYLLPHLWKEDEPVAHDPIKYHHEFGFETTRELKSKLVKQFYSCLTSYYSLTQPINIC